MLNPRGKSEAEDGRTEHHLKSLWNNFRTPSEHKLFVCVYTRINLKVLVWTSSLTYPSDESFWDSLKNYENFELLDFHDFGLS